MTFRETREASEGSSAASVGLASTDERETPVPVVDDSEEDTPQAVVEETYAPSPSKGEDPVRLYLKEIGKVSLLSARQEVEIGRRIEEGQMRLRRALVGIPMAVRALSEVGGNLRRRQTDPDDVIVLPEGGELDAEEIKSVLNAFGRVRRLTREIDRLQ